MGNFPEWMFEPVRIINDPSHLCSHLDCFTSHVGDPVGVWNRLAPTGALLGNGISLVPSLSDGWKCIPNVSWNNGCQSKLPKHGDWQQCSTRASTILHTSNTVCTSHVYFTLCFAIDCHVFIWYLVSNAYFLSLRLWKIENFATQPILAPKLTSHACALWVCSIYLSIYRYWVPVKMLTITPRCDARRVLVC